MTSTTGTERISGIAVAADPPISRSKLASTRAPRAAIRRADRTGAISVCHGRVSARVLRKNATTDTDVRK